MHRRLSVLSLIGLLLIMIVALRHTVFAESPDGVTTLVSLNSDGEQGNWGSILLSISDDGRYALFFSESTNLVDGVIDDWYLDVLRHDLVTGQTLSLASVPYTNSQGVSGVAAVANGIEQGGMSADGQIVVFVSGENFIVTNDTNDESDIFIREVETGALTRITRQDDTEFDLGAYKPKLSADGAFVLFTSRSTNIDTGPRWREDLYLYERSSGAIARITKRQAPGDYDEVSNYAVSDNGRFVLFSSRDATLIPGQPADGQLRAYLYDRLTDAYQVIGPADGFASLHDITPDGRYIVATFTGEAILGSLPTGSSSEQVFVYDTSTASFSLISKNENGQPMDGAGGGLAISDDGRYVLFLSDAGNLVPGLVPYRTRLYLADRHDGSLRVISSGQSGQDANDSVYNRSALYGTAMTPDGRYIGFTSKASNLVTGDTNHNYDAFVYKSPLAADAGGPYSGNEGSAIPLDGTTASDPAGNMMSYAWTVDSTLCSFDNNLSAKPNLTCDDDGNYTVTVSVSDGIAPGVTDTASVAVENVAPSALSLTPDTSSTVVAIRTPIGFGATFIDPAGVADESYTCRFDWGDNSAVSEVSSTHGACDGTVSYGAPGVYTVKYTVQDKDGAVSNELTYGFVVVYDPGAGFITGVGWIDSPVGAYTTNSSLTGKATFGFVARYKRGQTTPDGNARFQFKAGDLTFQSTSYDWLVVAGKNAKFKGIGTIDGAGEFSFMITATDGDLLGGGQVDGFRIKIWDANGVVYDNQMGLDDGSTDTTDLGGGSIAIHNK